MYKVKIDKIFFDLNSPKAKGLISGLKKLSQKNFDFEVEDFNNSIKSNLSKILSLEEIEINKTGKNYQKEFSVKSNEKDFNEAVNNILISLRTSVKQRKTKETEIKLSVSLDGTGESIINTGIGFFDHMLEQIAKHSNINLNIKVNGDLNVDEHHTVEDAGIVLGEALSEALGDKIGIKRYGFFLPMDDSIAECAIDLGGRAYLNFKCKFKREKVGEFPTELVKEFFRGLSSSLKANIFISSKGENDHHKIEAIFKAFAKALNEACRFDERNDGKLPSTKGIL